MNKQEFLNQLRERLHVLNDEELEALIQEYDETINDAMADGKSEEEAVASFGDLEELVRELLDAYKLRQPQQKKTVDFAEEGKKAVEKLGNVSLLSITEWIIIAFALVICYILIHICIMFTSGVFSILVNFFNYLSFYTLIHWIFILIELIVDILLTIKVVKGRMNGLQMAEVFNLAYLFDLEDGTLEINRFKKKDKKDEEGNEESVVEEGVDKKHFQFRKKEKVVKERKNLHFGSGLWNLIKAVFKLCVFMIALPFILMAFIILVMGVVLSAGSLVLSFSGYPLIGISIAGLGGCAALAALFYLVYQLCKRENILIAGGIFLGGLIFCGIGAGVSFLEYTNLDVVYLNEEELVDQESIEMPQEGFIEVRLSTYDYIIQPTDEDVVKISTYDNGYRHCELLKDDDLDYGLTCEYQDTKPYDEFKDFLKNFRENMIYVQNYHPAYVFEIPNDADYTVVRNGYGLGDSILIGTREEIEKYIREREERIQEGV